MNGYFLKGSGDLELKFPCPFCKHFGGICVECKDFKDFRNYTPRSKHHYVALRQEHGVSSASALKEYAELSEALTREGYAKYADARVAAIAALWKYKLKKPETRIAEQDLILVLEFVMDAFGDCGIKPREEAMCLNQTFVDLPQYQRWFTYLIITWVAAKHMRGEEINLSNLNNIVEKKLATVCKEEKRNGAYGYSKDARGEHLVEKWKEQHTDKQLLYRVVLWDDNLKLHFSCNVNATSKHDAMLLTETLWKGATSNEYAICYINELNNSENTETGKFVPEVS